MQKQLLPSSQRIPPVILNLRLAYPNAKKSMPFFSNVILVKLFISISH